MPFFILAFLILGSSASGVTLEAAFRAALSKSEPLGQAREQTAQAEERIVQVRGAALPELTFNALHTIQPEPADPVARQFSPQHQTTLNFGLVQPLFRGLREFSGIRQQKRLRDAQLALEKHASSRLYLEVASVFLTVLSLEKDLENVREQAAVYQGRIEALSARVRRGESAESEVLTARSTEASLLAEARLIEGQLEAQRETFFFLTALPQSTPLTDPDLLAKGEAAVLPLESYLARVEQRPDIVSLRERHEAANENVSFSWGAHWPRADLVANYYLTRPGFLSDLKWDVGFKLTVPLFEGGATHAKVREAISKRAETELELARARRAASQEIRSLRKRLLARLDHVEKLQHSVELAEKNARLLEREFARGLARNIDVQLALSDLRVARRGLDQSRYQAQLELLQLRTAAWEGVPQ